MKKFIKVEPKCDTCQCQLAIVDIYIDIANCAYIIRAECIVCQKEHIFILSLDDFIKLSQKLFGVSDENLN